MSDHPVIEPDSPPGSGVARAIPESAESRDPVELFAEWYASAEEAEIPLPEGMCLATASEGGQPSVRMVLLKGFDTRGFVFFTNYGSRKAQELDENPRAALCFHWPTLERQVRINGGVTRISREESEEYFRSRARGSRIGAWASEQSRPLGSRETLEDRVRVMEERFGEGEVPLPPFWGGYRVEPQTIEFWQGRDDRLHDRLVFTREGDGWSTMRLYP
ncbi:MAG: pyridoxamine 5'-phosphate oxidase [Longimicrobiales bacterium]|nr:pyridoxamine 5'-phosphate oxidase [Longimicrobiales bacterium]